MADALQLRDTGISVLDVLDMISQGYTYEQILFSFRQLSYNDIFLAARKAKRQLESHAKVDPIAAIRRTHPRAYEKWTEEEEERLKKGFEEGLTTKELSRDLQRQQGGVEARLRRLGLLQ